MTYAGAKDVLAWSSDVTHLYIQSEVLIRTKLLHTHTDLLFLLFLLL